MELAMWLEFQIPRSSTAFCIIIDCYKVLKYEINENKINSKIKSVAFEILDTQPRKHQKYTIKLKQYLIQQLIDHNYQDIFKLFKNIYNNQKENKIQIQNVEVNVVEEPLESQLNTDQKLFKIQLKKILPNVKECFQTIDYKHMINFRHQLLQYITKQQTTPFYESQLLSLLETAIKYPEYILVFQQMYFKQTPLQPLNYYLQENLHLSRTTLSELKHLLQQKQLQLLCTRSNAHSIVNNLISEQMNSLRANQHFFLMDSQNVQYMLSNFQNVRNTRFKVKMQLNFLMKTEYYACVIRLQLKDKLNKVIGIQKLKLKYISHVSQGNTYITQVEQAASHIVRQKSKQLLKIFIQIIKIKLQMKQIRIVSKYSKLPVSKSKFIK
ncbi:Hypothetical_protein [Hexamita inflata]|uniref:Hypothetical_protein n=1 Tax=Hexamita inflata TaxID=28002 RepID=A0AA86UVU5_9EUKA|nr:Hypothetical protein HINF_LOCUS61470 [Hexamita inflata]